ncbi:MAG: nucleotide sugar dehydrogenase [Propionicimonas sp.]
MMNGDEVEALAVIGLGYVGLPLAREASRAGIPVIGFDVSETVVSELAAGRSQVDDISDDDISRMLADGFSPTLDAAALLPATTYVICVPTPLSPGGGPDLAAVESASRAVAAALASGDLVVLESTTYPGTTEEFVAPILEQSGLRAGADFHLAFSPERIDPGNPHYGLRNTPKVVGGIDEASTAAACAFYEKVCNEVVPAKGAREAELAKLLENTYRHVNIALVNEMAQFCHELDIDFWDAIRLASTKPFGFQAFYPGPGVGGHCIPIDPNYLSHHVRSATGQAFRFVELAQEINAGMPAYVVRRAQGLLNEHGKAVNGSRVRLLGVTYKANIADQRESPAVPVARGLLRLGADVTYWDPFVDAWQVDGVEVPRSQTAGWDQEGLDLLVLLQAHESLGIPTGEHRVPLLDTRGRAAGVAVARL